MSYVKKCKYCGRYLCGHEVYEKDGKTLTLLKTVPPCKAKGELNAKNI